ncbi:dTDP-4-dehydrorhamnose reductase [Sinisalibacter aestuarii]|uniref:dTDP-4-dehydrorhamnose reductase n=1 Tax=Sinisalibacter aestuarii TaxID=2949426 RepID=A0ABQ5LUH9_9RHOB|nr:dTDP-4-dehydrorhamnose reductase [Sinisalibacter aestuarii]GKY88628.1 NAD(P)-dependent oxidoreductase [Sinisalibacter aestuarii]
MILVFGKSGQVARELGRLPTLRCLGRDEADLADPAACAAAIHAYAPRAVINAAAYTAVDKAEAEEGVAHLINAEAPGAMAEACAACGIPFVHISTDYVFNGSGAAPRTPEDATAPLNAYGRSKLAGEAKVRASGAQAVILRTSWVFSAHGRNFVTTMLALSASRDRLDVVADQIGGPTPARAIAAACHGIARAMQDDPQMAGTYHFSGAPDVSWQGFAQEIFREAGRAVTLRPVASADWPSPAARPLNSRLDCSATMHELGLARPDWRAGLAEVLAEISGKVR